MASRMAGATGAVLSLAKFILQNLAGNACRAIGGAVWISVLVRPPAIALVTFPWSTEACGPWQESAPDRCTKNLFVARARALPLCCRREFAMFRIGQHCCPNW